MAHFLYTLCSSSSGNCCYFGNGSSGILIDTGLSMRRLHAQLGLVSVDPQGIKAVFVTHEHTDHISGLRNFTERYSVPVFGSEGTLNALIQKDAISAKTQLYEIDKKTISIDQMEVGVFHTSHDSAESLGITITTQSGKKTAVCTDLGYVSQVVQENLDGCDIVMLESNYDEEMLACGSYHPALKRRVCSDVGHLSNPGCAKEITRLAKNGTSKFVLAHLSKENNRPETALAETVSALHKNGLRIEQDYQITVAPRIGVGKMIEV
ncbi:MAG: MBL fold metallo-hydrolase [Oscillospiraceae bacterium]|nr:MBL fold metallo-hydrolase [Oscillospiraceae bacterium]